MFVIVIDAFAQWETETWSSLKGVQKRTFKKRNLPTLRQVSLCEVFAKVWFPKGFFCRCSPVPDFPLKSLSLQCCPGTGKLCFLIFLISRTKSGGRAAKYRTKACSRYRRPKFSAAESQLWNGSNAAKPVFAVPGSQRMSVETLWCVLLLFNV